MRKLHLYLGLGLSLPLLVTVTTGMILGFHDWIQGSHFPFRLPQTTPYLNQPLSAQQWIQNFQRQNPSAHLEALHLPLSSHQSARIKAKSLETGKSQIYFIDPFSGAILFQQGSEVIDTLEWIYQIHRGTWMGRENRRIMSILALGMILLWPTGWIIRKKRIQRQRALPSPMNPRIWPLSLHRRLGLLGGLVFVGMAGTGVLMNDMGKLMEWLDPAPQDTVISSQIHLDSHLDQDVTNAKSLRPQSQLRSIYFPQLGHSLVLLYFQDNSRVYLHAMTHEIIKVMSPTQHWIHALYPLHSGRILGFLSIPFILGSGILVWMITLTGLNSTRQFQKCKKVGQAWIQLIPPFKSREKITTRLSQSS